MYFVLRIQLGDGLVDRNGTVYIIITGSNLDAGSGEREKSGQREDSEKE